VEKQTDTRRGSDAAALGFAARLATTTLMVALATTACLAGGKLRPTLENPTPADVGRLWQDPVDIAERNLFFGPGGKELVPDPAAGYVFVAVDDSGYSSGYDVRDPNGLEWSVKLGPEAQPEIAVSRILWAIGYHQPPTYYVPAWMLIGAQGGPQPAGRFRPKLPDRKVVAEWSWYENEVLATQEFRGLLVANVMLNNWDWKTSNNKVYETVGKDGRPTQVMVVQDLGASLGKTAFPRLLSWFPTRGLGQGSRNDLEDFESQGFITNIDGDQIEFDYRGIHRSLVETLKPADVRWTAELMSRLSEQQWLDAFRAAGYDENVSRRYVTKIKSKVAQGLSLSDIRTLEASR
jgi:hypothetical protein